MAVRLLSVSYDQSLLVTRQTLLERQGYEVVSALGLSEAMQVSEAGGFDLFILGHSIPVADKCALIQRFRESSPGRLVLSLVRHGDIRIAAADNNGFHQSSKTASVALHVCLTLQHDFPRYFPKPCSRGLRAPVVGWFCLSETED